MTKPYHKPPTSIDQAEIIPFPERSLWRHKLSILRKGGHMEFFSICGFVSGLVERIIETRNNWDKLQDDIQLLEALENTSHLNLTIDFIEEKYSEIYSQATGGAR